MVYDWFNRRAEPAQSAQPTPSPEDTVSPAPDAESVEPSVESAPSRSEEGPPTESLAPLSEPVVSGPVSDSELPQPSVQPSTEQANPDDDPLEWARQAYARLKAQKEQEKAQQDGSAPAAPSPAPADVAEPQSSLPPQPPSAEQASAQQALSLIHI